MAASTEISSPRPQKIAMILNSLISAVERTAGITDDDLDIINGKQEQLRR